MMKNFTCLACVFVASLLGGCMEQTGSVNPDYRILVAPAAHGGYVAIPPECASWRDAPEDPFDNQPIPNHGCANARNLALMIDDPRDLIKGKAAGGAPASRAATAIERYQNDKIRGLYDPTSLPAAKE